MIRYLLAMSVLMNSIIISEAVRAEEPATVQEMSNFVDLYIETVSYYFSKKSPSLNREQQIDLNHEFHDLDAKIKNFGLPIVPILESRVKSLAGTDVHYTIKNSLIGRVASIDEREEIDEALVRIGFYAWG